MGVAGAGKTTMLAAVASVFESSGCQVVGTATAGQAARTLADGAALGSSSTLASLVGRLDRGQLRLDERSVVILDEAGMTDDVDLARLTTHARLDQEIGRLQTGLDALDRRSVTAVRRWQQTVGEHAAATREQQRLGRALQGARRRLEQPDASTQGRRPPISWKPAGGYIAEPEPAASTDAVPPGL